MQNPVSPPLPSHKTKPRKHKMLQKHKIPRQHNRQTKQRKSSTEGASPTSAVAVEDTKDAENPADKPTHLKTLKSLISQFKQPGHVAKTLATQCMRLSAL